MLGLWVMEGWGALDELPEPLCPQHCPEAAVPPCGSVASAKASAPRPALATSFLKLTQFSFRSLVPGREGRGGHSCSPGTSPLPSATFSIMSCPPTPGLHFIRSLPKILPLMLREWLEHELGGGGRAGDQPPFGGAFRSFRIGAGGAELEAAVAAAPRRCVSE